MRDVLKKQDYLYTMVERDATGDQARVIGSILDFLFAPENREAVLERMASPECRIVSLTITEGGYYVNQGTGEFDAENPDIQHDLRQPGEPICSFGYLIEALDRRRTRGLAPFTVMSCDNLQNNGDIAKRMLCAFAELRDPQLGNWIRGNVAFPNSMVDRITPATTDEHRALLRDKFGIADDWPVMPESFRQWVIEDHFPTGRPPWEEAGAQMTSEVLPYEKMKLRLLNGSHQGLCYIGMLLGYQFADEAMADPLIHRLIKNLMDFEVTALVPPVPGIDLEQYKEIVLQRFANPAVRDQLLRIGTEGSARIPKFVLPSIQEQLERGGPIRLLSFTVASWFRYLRGVDDQGRALAIVDPLEATLRERALQGGSDPGPLFDLSQLFSETLRKNETFVQTVRTILGEFDRIGARATLERWLSL
jgi:mannitol 2-dehydrogenase